MQQLYFLPAQYPRDILNTQSVSSSRSIRSSDACSQLLTRFHNVPTDGAEASVHDRRTEPSEDDIGGCGGVVGAGDAARRRPDADEEATRAPEARLQNEAPHRRVSRRPRQGDFRFADAQLACTYRFRYCFWRTCVPIIAPTFMCKIQTNRRRDVICPITSPVFDMLYFGEVGVGSYP